LCHERAVVDDILNDTHHTGSPFAPTEANRDTGPSTAERMRYYEENAPKLAVQASIEALGHAGLAPQDITHLVTVSCTGFFAPGIDTILMRELCLPPETQRTHVGFMGCHGALNGLRVANALSRSDPSARVLVCAVELCSVHFQYRWEPNAVLADALFSDGAAAMVGGNVGTDDWRLAASASHVFPGTENAMTWTITDHGFVMTLSNRVPKLIATNLRAPVERWLAKHELDLSKVASWAIHPGGPKIVTAAAEALELSNEQTAVSRQVLEEYGNMSSPTLLFIVERLRRSQAPRPCVALGFGPGLVMEAALFV
jgi:predicted naringenin-chalcone synthase